MLKKQIKKSKKVDPVRGREGAQRASTSNGVDIGFEFHRLGVLVEHSNDKWDLIAEQYGGIKKNVGEIAEKLDGVIETVGKLAVDMSIVKEDIEFIKGGLKKKVDVEEFTALERRVMLLEKKVK